MKLYRFQIHVVLEPLSKKHPIPTKVPIPRVRDTFSHNSAVSRVQAESQLQSSPHQQQQQSEAHNRDRISFLSPSGHPPIISCHYHQSFCPSQPRAMTALAARRHFQPFFWISSNHLVPLSSPPLSSYFAIFHTNLETVTN